MKSNLKFGFHLGSGGGNATGLGEFLNALNDAGIATFTMSADMFPYDAQQLAINSPDVGHTAVFRRSVGHNGTKPPSGNPDVPEYHQTPAHAALRHTSWHLSHRPPEMIPGVTWLVTENEIASRFEFDNEAAQQTVPLFNGLRQRYTRLDDNGRTIYGVTNAGWMAAYSLYAAQTMLAQGQKWAAFGWASGNPEPEDWQHPQMLEFLSLCGQHPDELGIAIHEYSWRTDDIWHGDGRLVGRVQDIFDTCRAHGIPYPTILITEWGWALDDVPRPATAMQHILSVGKFYAQFPSVKGAGIWYLGPGFGGIADKAQKLIAPLRDLTLATEFDVEPYPEPGNPPPPDPDPEPEPNPEPTAVLTELFNNGWYDDTIGQVPNGWTLATYEGDCEWNPAGWMNPETRVLWSDFLPPEEHEKFLNEAGYCYKIFAAHKSYGIVMGHETSLPQGTYTIRLRYVDDCYHPSPDPPPDPLSFEWAVAIGAAASAWTPSRFRQENDVSATLTGSGRPYIAFRSRWGIAHAAAFVKSIVVETVPVTPPQPPDPEPNGRTLGTDVSRWQGAIDFQKMADAGARFVYIKASQGDGWTDPNFLLNWTNAGRAHWVDADGHVWPLLRGAYHYYLNTISPEAQAAYMLSVIPASDPGELPLAGDFEEPSPLDAERIHRFQRGIIRDERASVVYTGGWWLRQWLRGDTAVLPQYPLWHSPQNQPIPRPWTAITIDQTPSTERGREFGCESIGLDLNHFRGDEADLLAWARLPAAGRGKPRAQYGRVYWLAPQTISQSEYLTLAALAYQKRRTIGFSADDAGIGALERKTAVLWNVPANEQDAYRQWFRTNYPGTNLAFAAIGADEPAPETAYTAHMVGGPRVQYARTCWVASQDIDRDTFVALAAMAYRERRTLSFSYDDAGIGDLGVRTAVLWNIPAAQRGMFADWYHTNYPGVLVEFREIAPEPDPTPPPAGTAVIGLHASADPGDLYGRTAEFNEFKTLRPGVIKILSAHSTASIARLADENPGASFIVRAFLDFGGRTVTPRQFFDWTLPDTRRAIDVLTNHGIGDIWVELHNEPNLTQEGWGASWADGRAFRDWLLAAHLLYKDALPGVKYIYPGLSPGGDVPGIRANSARFLADSKEAVWACDAVGVHCYWSNGWPMASALLHLDNHKYLNRPAWITEASRNDRPAIVPATTYAAEYVQFWHELGKRPWVRGVTYFVASASNGYFAPECWVVGSQSKGIAREIRRLAP